MSELDNAAAGKATKAAFDHWESLEDEAHALGFSTTWEEVGGVVRECWVNSTRAAITAYLAAAARPTPDADIDPSVTIPPQRTREAMGRVVNRRNGTPSDLLDAVAAPAVGVSNRVTANELVVAYGKAAIAWSKDTSNQSLGDAMDAAKHRVIDALLTAQPEPGTHGNGCPACDGKGWVEEKCLVCFGDGFDDDDEPGTHDDAGQPAEGARDDHAH